MDQEQLHDLILKEHYGLLSPEEGEELADLLANSEEARRMREEIRREVPEDEALEAMAYFNPERNLELIRYEADRVRERKRRRLTLLSAAAVLAVALGAAWYLLRPSPGSGSAVAAAGAGEAGVTLKLADGRKIALNDSGSQTISLQATTLTANNRQLEYSGARESSGWNTLTVPPKLDFQVKLADGTIVWLNSISEIKFPFHFSEGKREVYIKGEAYFKVAPDAQQPFIVHTSNTSITVLGTEFNVNAYNQGIITTSLVSGKVAVSAEERSVELKPGNQAVVRGAEQIRVQPFDHDLLSWRQGVYYFEESTMREIASMLERWYDIKVVLDNAGAGEKRFRVKLHRNRPLQPFLDQLNETGQVTLYWNGDQLHCK